MNAMNHRQRQFPRLTCSSLARCLALGCAIFLPAGALAEDLTRPMAPTVLSEDIPSPMSPTVLSEDLSSPTFPTALSEDLPSPTSPTVLPDDFPSPAAPAVPPDQLMTAGQRFENGVGAPQDLDRAIEHYCSAAVQAHAEARYHLGWLYVSGRLGKRDEVLAAAWFQSAAGLGHTRASQQLQSLKAQGLDLEPDPPCVRRDQMVARRLADLRPKAEADEAPASRTQDEGPRLWDIGAADIIALVERLAPDYRLDPDLVLAVIETESNFNIAAKSPKNAQGLMQLIPATADRFGVVDVWDPVQNLKGGMAYLRWLLDHFAGNLELALAGYNAGEQAVTRHGGVPPYPETQAYVKRIQRRLGLAADEGRPPAATVSLSSNG